MNLVKREVCFEDVITVDVLEVFDGECLVKYEGKGIVIDLFTTDYILEDDCPVFEGQMMMYGAWYDEEVFLVTYAEPIK